MQDSFFSIKEFASLLRVHPNTIRRGIKKGKINAFQVGVGKCSVWRIPLSETNRMGVADLEKIIDRIIEEKISTVI